MKRLSILLIVFLTACGVNNQVYNLELELKDGEVVTRQYKLPDSIEFKIKKQKKNSFLTYEHTNDSVLPYCLKRGVISFKVLKL